MSKSIEERLRGLPQAEQDEFWKDCTAVAGTVTGRRMLAVLCKICHPLESPITDTTDGTMANVGRQEVVSALWRRSEYQVTPQNLPMP